MYIHVFLLLLGAGLLLEALMNHSKLKAALGRRPEPQRLFRYPSVTVIRPIKGLDVEARENIRAALDTSGYPGEVENLFVFDEDTEPAYPLVIEEIEAHRKAGKQIDAGVIFSKEPPPGRTGKLNAMIAGFEAAKGELIAFADSDIRPDRDCLRIMVETLLVTPEAGSAFTPVVVTSAPVTFGDAGYALLLNGLYGPAAALSTINGKGELPFIMGQFMIFPRQIISDICGLESAEGQLVDDMYLGARVKAAGYRNVVSPRSVPVIQYGLALKEFWRTYVRWITFSRSGLPGRDFKFQTYVRPIIYWTGLLAAIIAGLKGWWFVAALNALAPVAITASTDALHRAFGGGKLNMLQKIASFALLLVAPVILASIRLRRSVNWRGRSYSLNDKSMLSAGKARPADQVCREHPKQVEDHPWVLDQKGEAPPLVAGAEWREMNLNKVVPHADDVGK